MSSSDNAADSAPLTTPPALLVRMRAQALTQALHRLSDELLMARIVAGTLQNRLNRAAAAQADTDQLATLLLTALAESEADRLRLAQ